VPLGEEIIQLFTDPGGVVLDPFCGSGAFLEAARLCGRAAVGCEIDEKWAWHTASRLSQRVLPFAPAPPIEQPMLFDAQLSKHP
jgi:23S rRNA G2445 N2-methylase RlmL